MRSMISFDGCKGKGINQSGIRRNGTFIFIDTLERPDGRTVGTYMVVTVVRVAGSVYCWVLSRLNWAPNLSRPRGFRWLIGAISTSAHIRYQQHGDILPPALAASHNGERLCEESRVAILAHDV